MPSDLMLKAMNTIHRGVLKLSGGRLGWEAMGMQVLELTTTGRKSGQPRSVMLTSPLQEGSTIVVVASRGGDDQHPAWFLNLRDNPDVTVTMEGRRRPMRATVATAEEKAALWPSIVAAYPNYDAYRRKTDRDIPVVVLKPVLTPSD
jgi:deazaflavin-dependent oxidoreductase (nitroreductase family)